MAEEKRKKIDCRDFPADKPCSVAISGTEDEVLKVAVQHAVATHGHKDSSELRSEIRKLMKDAD